MFKAISHQVIILICVVAALVLICVGLASVLRWYLLKQVITCRPSEHNVVLTDPDAKACETLYVNTVNTDKTPHNDSDIETSILSQQHVLANRK